MVANLPVPAPSSGPHQRPSGPLRDLAPATKHWKRPVLSHPSGHSGLVPNLRRWKDSAFLPRYDPARVTGSRLRPGEKSRMSSRADERPIFPAFRCGTSGPDEVQQRSNRSSARSWPRGLAPARVVGRSGRATTAEGAGPTNHPGTIPPPSLAPGRLFLPAARLLQGPRHFGRRRADPTRALDKELPLFRGWGMVPPYFGLFPCGRLGSSPGVVTRRSSRGRPVAARRSGGE